MLVKTIIPNDKVLRSTVDLLLTFGVVTPIPITSSNSRPAIRYFGPIVYLSDNTNCKIIAKIRAICACHIGS